MCNEKPSDLSQYREWIEKKHNFEISKKSANHFDAVALKVRNEFMESLFWKKLTSNMQTYNEEYLLKTSYHLFSGSAEAPKINLKTFDSFFLKTFRTNIIKNKNWPKSPENGWSIPPTWLSQGNDIIRTCFVVKYLDGVEFLINAIKTLAEESNLKFWKYYVAGNDGYYAAHVYVKNSYEVPSANFDTEYMDMTVELQITSQLQEVIKKLLHKHFEEDRKLLDPQDTEWQWNYKCPRFSTNYLGHILHYVEGMIMEVRDRNKKLD